MPPPRGARAAHAAHAAHAALAALAALGALGAARAQTWTHVSLADPRALCLDGSAGAFEIKAGEGANASKWVLFQQAGGWAMSEADLLYRSTTSLGSTRGDPAASEEWAIEDLLTNDTARNPLFHDWTSVALRYCDGASRASDLAAPLVVNGSALYLRGFPILRATLDALLSPGSPGGGAPSLGDATEVVVGGGSAGGLGATLHVDYVAGRVRAAAAGKRDVRVSGISTDGFFIDGASIWGGEHVMTGVFRRVVALGNVSGSAQDVNAACATAFAPDLQWRCFLAEYALPFVKTPMFFFNSFMDQYQSMTMLSPDLSSLDAPGGVVQYAPFVPCTHAPESGCNATQYEQWSTMREQFLSRFAAALAASPIAAEHGAFLPSCPTHGTCVFNRCNTVRLPGGAAGGLTGMQALQRWYAGDAAREGNVTIDAAWPAPGAWPNIVAPNKDCPAPW